MQKGERENQQEPGTMDRSTGRSRGTAGQKYSVGKGVEAWILRGTEQSSAKRRGVVTELCEFHPMLLSRC